MLTIHEGVFELFVVKDEYATEAQVAQALKVQRKRKKSGEKVRLDELMVELGHLEEDEADEIRDRLDDEIIPGYRLHEELGRGGMGTVYRATQLSMERDVAVKVLSRRLSKDKKFCKKFLQEARNAAKLNHENIMGGIDCGESNGLHYFVMEYVPGESLVDQIDRDGPLKIDRAFYLLEQVARGLKHAHGQKIVHRDIKPENIMLTREGVVKICDLGLAKPEIKAGEGVKGGTCEGTPYYCAPEQALGRTDIDVKADVYALGASMFHLLTNRTPFDGESARAILWQQVNTPFPDWKAEVPDLSSDQRRLLEDMVIKKRENRLASMDELLERLQALKAAANITKGPSRRLQSLAGGQGGLPVIPIAVAVLVLLGVVGGVIAMNMGKTDEEPVAAVTDPDPKPKETKRRPVTLVEVHKPDKKDEDKPKVDDEAAKLIRQANRLFQEAKNFEASNPENPQLSMVKFRNVVDQFPGTGPAIKAAAQVQRLTKKSQKLVANKWGQLVKDIDGKRAKGLYKQAMAAIESFNESYDTRLLNPYQRRMDKKRKDILGMIERDIDSLGSQLRDWADDAEADDPEQYKKIDTLKGNCPENTHAKLEELRKEIQDLVKVSISNLKSKSLRKKIDALLREGDLAGARWILDAARSNPDLASNKKSLDAKHEELNGIARAWNSFDTAFKDMIGKTKQYDFKSGEDEKATLKTYSSKSLELDLKIYGFKEQKIVKCRELSSDFLMKLLPSVSSLQIALGNMNFCLVRGFYEEALLCLTAAEKLGITDKALVQKLKDSRTKLLDQVSKQLIAELVKTEPGPKALSLAERIKKNYTLTAAYKANRQQVIDAFVKSRALQIMNDEPEKLFNGKAEKISKKTMKYRLTYKFETQKELADFLVDKKTIGKSSTKFAIRNATIMGRIRHKARFEGGALKMEMKCQIKNRKRPNINVMICDQGGLDGVFVGIGTRMNAKDVTLSDDAPKRLRGQRVFLPAHIVADAKNKNWRYLFGSRKPTFPKGKGTIRYYLDRSKRGTLTVKIGSRQYIAMPDSPRADEAGSIGFYLQGVAMQISEIKLEGTLEKAWLEKEAQKVALVEAASFPGTPAPKKGKKK